MTLNKGEYENERFESLNLSDADFNHIRFIDCTFVGCNLSNIKPNYCRFQDVKFESCKVIGVDFTKVDPWLFGVAFKDCVLNMCNFSALKLNGTNFSASSLREATFNEAELAKANFSSCDLKGAVFNKNDLRGANFLGAKDYSINPTANKIQKARFDIPQVISLLSFFDIQIG